MPTPPISSVIDTGHKVQLRRVRPQKFARPRENCLVQTVPVIKQFENIYPQLLTQQGQVPVLSYRNQTATKNIIIALLLVVEYLKYMSKHQPQVMQALKSVCLA